MRDDRFEWDDAKAASNIADHGVAFELAQAVFDDPNAIIEADDDPDEERWRQIGMAVGRILFVVFAERVADDDPMLDEPRVRIRIISARKANRNEQQRYYRQAL